MMKALQTRFSLVLLPLVLWALGCGPVYATLPEHPMPTEEATGALVVHNETPDTLALSVDGALVTTLAPGGDFRSARLPVGRYHVVARDAERDVFHERLVLIRADGEERWLIRAQWGALLVANHGAQPVQVDIEGAAGGRVAVGAESLFAAIPAGLRRVVVSGPAGGALRDVVLPFREGAPTRLTLGAESFARPEPATLVVSNATDEPLLVFADGRRLGRVRRGASQRFEGLSPGHASLEARTTRHEIVDTMFVLLSPGSLTEWEVIPQTSRLRIRNRSTQRHAIRIDGQPMGVVRAGAERLYAGLRPGRRTIEAHPTDGGLTRQRDIVCPPGGEVEWTIEAPPAAAIDVRNGTQEPLEIRLDGKPLGLVRPGFTTRFGALLAGPRRLEAHPPGGPAHVREVTLVAGEVLGWVIGPRPASLRVRSEWREPAIVILDGHRLGRVPPGGEALFEGIVPGRRVLRAERTGAETQRDSLLFEDGRESLWLLRAEAPATLRVINRNPVAIEASLRGRPLGEIPARAQRSFRELPPGLARVAADSATGQRVEAELSLPAGGLAVWEVRLPAQASLRVFNRSGLSVEIRLDGAVLGTIARGGSALYEGLSAGGHTVSALSGREILAEQRVILATGPEVNWVVAPAQATLRLGNATTEALDVVTPGVPRFRLPRGEQWHGETAPGRLSVRGVGVESKARYDLVGELAPGGELTLTFPERRARLTVENVDAEALEIRVDGGPPHVVAPGARISLEETALGVRAVSARGLASGRVEKRRVKVGEGGARLRFGPK